MKGGACSWNPHCLYRSRFGGLHFMMGNCLGVLENINTYFNVGGGSAKLMTLTSLLPVYFYVKINRCHHHIDQEIVSL